MRKQSAQIGLKLALLVALSLLLCAVMDGYMRRKVREQVKVRTDYIKREIGENLSELDRLFGKR